jgi:hypothetical protein
VLLATAKEEPHVVANGNEHKTIFADGFGKIAVVNNIVRLDLVEVEPMPNGVNQERPVARLMLPLNMMGALLGDLNRIVSQAGAAAQAPAAAAPPPPATAAAGGTMIPAPPLGPPPRWNPKS